MATDPRVFSDALSRVGCPVCAGGRLSMFRAGAGPQEAGSLPRSGNVGLASGRPFLPGKVQLRGF